MDFSGLVNVGLTIMGLLGNMVDKFLGFLSKWYCVVISMVVIDEITVCFMWPGIFGQRVCFFFFSAGSLMSFKNKKTMLSKSGQVLPKAVWKEVRWLCRGTFLLGAMSFPCYFSSLLGKTTSQWRGLICLHVGLKPPTRLFCLFSDWM